MQLHRNAKLGLSGRFALCARSRLEARCGKRRDAMASRRLLGADQLEEFVVEAAASARLARAFGAH